MKLADLTTSDFLDNPYPFYAELRAEGPLVRIGPQAVITGRYDVIEAILHDRRFGKNYPESIRIRYGEDAMHMRLFQGFSRMFLVMNPPSHTRQRALIAKAFDARQVEAMKETAHRAAHELIDAFEREKAANLVTQFAFPLPLRMIGQMLDIPDEDAMQLGVAASAVAKVIDVAPMNADDLGRACAGYEDLEHYFHCVVEARRRRPGSDLISMMLTVEDEGETLSQDEIVSNTILLFLAGHETTSNMIGNALVALHRHPDQLALLKEKPALLRGAVLECMRYDSSAQTTIRSALEDVEIAGVEVPCGTSVLLMFGSANRDPSRHAHPERLDIERDEGRLQTFGSGIHHCLGHRMALVLLESALSVLLQRLPGLELTGLDSLSWNRRGNLRGVTSLDARW
ncbi:cytochrome P450 [Paraburkholderia sp. SOS3]|uniref:cytochrome P450 n=1 Tax=Paraburkholderia sp. SOS3 TaxID=1926494 RepID=UPI0009473BBC|nr:cytochrome P450 [Paraburkholderia sp. SOS3]APR39527.1 cytochrome [Paraburkholderia sp. SOS3]